ncbi:hypothetical protein OnM2_094036 [Erysiphe neolycopersici]|uniref:Uncharacterized protein n=1 Tax=Erysiphe neolycopersici TaxID=212602 RepID=A0A420HBQ2_9PEZI|nr:hypothetical protein OnM2_094036 [Erysiphe neolycopersici]
MSKLKVSQIESESPGILGPRLQLNEKMTSHFSLDQIALALTIQKSKPERLSTNEYCDQLRKHIKVGKPSIARKPRYIDTVEFWKDQYTKIHKQKQELEDKINCVEQLKFLASCEDQDDENTLITFKQYAQRLISSVSSRENSNILPLKKALARSGEHSKVRSHEEMVLGEAKLINLCGNALRIRRQRSLLGKALLNTSTLVQVENLAKLTCQVLEVIKITIWNSCQPFWLLKTSQSHVIQIFQNLMDQIALAFLVCFDALNELCKNILGRGYKYETTYRMVMFFQKSLELMHSSVYLQTEHEKYHFQDVCSKDSTTIEEDYIVIKSVARCLTSILQNLNWDAKNSSHSDFCEGIIFLILDYTGRLISEAVFSEHVAGSDNPGNITNTAAQVNQSVIRLESKYIVQILQAALDSESKKRVVANILSSNINRDDRCTLADLSMSYEDLFSRATFLLQSTLVKSAVGGETMESLRLPTPPTERVELDSVEGNEEKYSSEWLLEKVWGIIGWDLIT